MSTFIPAGLYKIEGNTLKKSTYKDADIYSVGSSWGPAHERYNTIAANNISDLNDPNGTENLNRRLLTATLDSISNQYSYQTPYFSIYDTGVAGASGGGSANAGSINGSPFGTATAPSFGEITFGTSATNPAFETEYNPIANFNPTGVGTISVNGYSPLDLNGISNPFFSGTVSQGYGLNSGTLAAPDPENHLAVFNSRLALIEKYCDKYGMVVDVGKIKADYSDDPEKGIEYCDDVINKNLDQSKLEKMLKQEYNQYNKQGLDAGKQISDTWVDTIIKSGLVSPSIAGGVSQNNVLDVIGTFMTNDEVKNGKVSLEHVFENPQVASQLMNALKAKAEEICKNPNISDDAKEEIVSKVADLQESYDEYADSLDDEDKRTHIAFNKVRKGFTSNYTDLFSSLRLEEAKANDKIAPQYYGLPKKSSIKFTSQTDRANEEINSYKNRKKLSTKL